MSWRSACVRAFGRSSPVSPPPFSVSSCIGIKSRFSIILRWTILLPTTQLPPCYNRLVFPAKIQGIIMPKLKTHKGASKRFKKTGTGLVVRNHAFGRHILTSKPHKRKKKLHQSVVADKADQPVLKRMIPY